jgi:hypothetical protein
MRRLRLTGPMRMFEATTIRGQSTQAAQANAEAWLVNQSAEDLTAPVATEGSPS